MRVCQTGTKEPLGGGGPEDRALRIRRVVDDAKSRGETIPSGIHLVGTREATEEEREFGEALEAAR